MASNNMDQVPRVLVTGVSEQAVIPSDLILISAETITLRKYNYVNGRTEVPTDLSLTVPKGVLLQIGDYKTLSKKGCDPKECYEPSNGIFGLYYISSDDDYKLLRVTRLSNIYIYTLRSDSWRKVESIQQIASNLTSTGSCWQEPIRHILLNEKLYFLKQIDRRKTFIHSYLILMFHTKTEKFTEIAAPSFGNQMTDCLSFMVLKGCIHSCVAILIEKEPYMTNRCCYEMIEWWRMDGDGDWTKVLTCGPMSFLIWGRSLLHVMRNGNLLIHHRSDVYRLDIMKRTKETVFTYEKLDDKFSLFGKYFETIPPIGKYIETTLSPNQYVEVEKRMVGKNYLEWCSYRSWETYEAYGRARAMITKYGKDPTQHPEDDAELWAQSLRGRKKARIFGIGSLDLH